MEEAAPALTPMETGKALCDGEISEIEEMKAVPVRELLGSLQFCATVSHPEISDALSTIARCVNKPSKELWNALIRVLKYLKGRKDEGLWYKKEAPITPVCFSDASFQSFKETSKSRTGDIILMAGSPVSWRSHWQSTIADSTCEAEYMAINEAGKEAIWMKEFLAETKLNLKESKVTIMVSEKERSEEKGDWLKIYGDNQGSLALASRQLVNSLLKHIRRKYHWIRENYQNGGYNLNYCRTQDMAADIFTKPVTTAKLKIAMRQLGLC
jgi:hypothetical protein